MRNALGDGRLESAVATLRIFIITFILSSSHGYLLCHFDGYGLQDCEDKHRMRRKIADCRAMCDLMSTLQVLWVVEVMRRELFPRRRVSAFAARKHGL